MIYPQWFEKKYPDTKYDSFERSISWDMYIKGLIRKPDGGDMSEKKECCAELTVMRTFDGGATRNTDEGKLDFEGFLSPAVIIEYAKYLHAHRLQADGKLRASDNWQKGIPKDVYMKSMFRHFVDAWSMHRSTKPLSYRNAGSYAQQIEALMAVAFNVFGYAFEIIKERDKNV